MQCLQFEVQNSNGAEKTYKKKTHQPKIKTNQLECYSYCYLTKHPYCYLTRKIPTNKEGDIVAKSQKYVTFSSLLQVSVAVQNISACQILLQQLTFRALKWVNKLIAKKNVIQTTTQTAAPAVKTKQPLPLLKDFLAWF